MSIPLRRSISGSGTTTTTTAERAGNVMPSLSIHILSIALCLSSGFQQGYIASVLNQPYAQIEQFINSSWIERNGHPIPDSTLHLLWSLLNVCFPIATIFGQFLAGWMCSQFGRKYTALIASFLYIPGVILCAAAKWCFPAFELLFVGRVIWSLANGVNTVNATVWIVECAPPQIRGRMAAMQEFFMALGSLLTQAVGVPFSTDDLWPYNFLPNCAVVVVSMLMFVWVAESPQFIMEKYNDVDRARKALAQYHGVSEDDPSVESEIRICEQSIGKKKQEKSSAGGIESSHSGMEIMFMPWRARDQTSRLIRYCAWVGVMVKIAYVFTGARSLRGYSTFILFTLSHFTYAQSTWLSFATGLLRLPFTLVPVFLVDRLGRRPLIVVSMLVSFLSILLMIIAIDINGEWKYATFIGLTVLLLINTCGIGSVSRFYSAELVPRNLLLSSVSTLTMFEALTKIGVEFAFYPTANVIGAQSLLLFLVPTGIFTVLCYLMCPETSRMTVNEVLNNVAAKKKMDVVFPM
uniref:MFS domain-containing protein n=1 Tax=Caenorhabditis japonica TaxID=281687 RepID=A0A8R1I9C5_CAEJA